jgi:hypothetical protein
MEEENELLRKAHAHVLIAVESDRNLYKESALKEYALALDFFKTYLKVQKVCYINQKNVGEEEEGKEEEIIGARAEQRAKLIGKIVQYQKRLQKLRREVFKKKYFEDEKGESRDDDDDGNRTHCTIEVAKTNEEEIELETIDDKELISLVNENATWLPKKAFDRSFSVRPRLMYSVDDDTDLNNEEEDEDGTNSARGEKKTEKSNKGGIFDWILDALDYLDDKIAEKVERAEDAIFDALEDVQISFKSKFSFNRNTGNNTDNNNNNNNNNNNKAQAKEGIKEEVKEV